MPHGSPYLWLTPLRALLLLSFLFAIAPSRAQVPRSGDFHTRVWTTDDGLPHNNVSEVLQDTTGFMWFATAGGLARFDGHEFREIRPPAEHLSGYNIRGLAEESGGGLLVVTTGGTLLRLQRGVWSVHPATSALSTLNETPMDVFVDTVGVIWIVTSSNRIMRWNQDASHQMLLGPETGFATAPKTV